MVEANSQELSQTKFDLGGIIQMNDDVVDLNLANYSDKDIFILRIDKPVGMDVKYKSKSLPSQEATLLRFKLNPKKKGKFEEEVKIYFSHLVEPQIVQFSGEVEELPKNKLQDCPSFRSSDMAQKSMSAYQQQAKSEIKSFFVSIGEGNPIEEEKEIIAETTKPIIAVETISQPQVKIEQKQNVENETTALVAAPIVNRAIENKDSLLGNEYIPNNIVFLIDASTSMREDNKMELLQKTMIELLNPLRPFDYLSIVSYSGEASVLLKPTSAIAKEDIEKEIMAIQANGSTNAVKGIKKAIEVAKSNYIEGGNNQIILSSDGAFDIGERNIGLRRKIEQNAKEGINITVLGIKNERWTNKSLKEIADLGGGDLLHCKSEKDTKKVLEEVKEQALK